MASFFQTIVGRIFGSSEPEDQLPDDGGLGEFAKQYAKQLEEEAKYGKKPGVSAEDVMQVQQGRHGARAYLLDTTDFRNAILKELRPSVAPITEGILKTRCGEKGEGFMNVEALYAFHLRKKDAVEEYNAAIGLIDEIGERLLGDRYVTGERKINVPVVQMEVEDLLTKNGTFNVRKVKKALKMIRETNTHGPAEIDWEKSEVKRIEGDPEWVPNEVVKVDKQQGDWQKQEISKKEQEQKSWQAIETQKKEENQKQWQAIETQKVDESAQQWQKVEQQQKDARPAEKWKKEESDKPVKDPKQQEWKKKEEAPKKDVVTAQEWGLSSELSQSLPAAENKMEQQPKPEEKPKPKPKKTEVQPTNLRQIGEITLAFRPTWQTREECINTYAGFAVRKVDGTVYSADTLYPDGASDKIIGRIDKAIAKQAAQHLEQTAQLNEKKIILPFHISSLSSELSRSPLKVLRELNVGMRNAVWIEIVGVDSSVSPPKVAAAIKAHSDKFKIFGLRFELGDVSRSMVERSQASFLSCDLDGSGTQSHRMIDGLSDLSQLARSHKKTVCTWGLRNRHDIEMALQEGSAFLNGHALAKDMRKPGKVIPVPASKLIVH